MARLTPEESAARRKARAAFSFTDAAYRHYDPRTEGYGSHEAWARQAEDLLNSKGVLRPEAKRAGQLDLDLAALYLSALPATAALLKTAFRNTLKIVHPDVGGSAEDTVKAIRAFERLAKHYA